jgi:hypothetical protein
MNFATRPLARLVVRLCLLSAFAALVVACGSFSRDLEAGTYRAVLELPGGELPFGLDVAREEEGLVLYLVNGEERSRITGVSAVDGRLTVVMPGHEGTLTAEIRGGRLEGEWSLSGTVGERQVLPFRAEAGQAWRFFEHASTDNADVAGRWAVTFTNEHGEESPGVAEFAQAFERVTGMILAPAGARRLLAGEMQGDELFLSRFDGVSAELYRARVDANGVLVGEHWSGNSVHRSFRAVRDPDAVLDADGATTALP